MIQVLSNDIINQIAAGEVVERPSHLVKELLENSLDAGATQITVEVSEGGRFIRVQDDGAGIAAGQLPMALQRHATSKITRTDDLWNLHTFGFRGEALASAAAVSKLTLKSISRDEKKPAQIESNFGVLSVVKPSSLGLGTEIKIEELFENVPARLKFLKSESAEFTQIKAVIKALALAHHNVEFKMISNGELQLFYPRRLTRLERVNEVIEKKQTFEAEGTYGHFKCHIVFSSPHEVAKTSKQIWIFAQNRWVQDRALQTAVMDAYRSLLMHGEYPHAVVWLECKPDEIDVNIHPTKSQVKFQDASSAFRVVHTTLRHALERAPWIAHPQTQAAYTPPAPAQPPVENLKFADHTFEKTQFKAKDFSMPSVSEFKPVVASVPAAAPGYWGSLQIIGQANLTYIVCQKHDRLVYVDQHAAHERVVFESLMKAWKEKKFQVQTYLFPLAVDLSEAQVEVLLKHSSEIQALGFEIEQLGPEAIGIKSAPMLIKDSGLPPAFEKMANDLLQNGGSFALEKKIGDLFATMACHSVVRAGQSLSASEMQELLNSMDEFALSSFCPHGRPVSVETSFTDLERLFGRIN
jgi:DNA mismatch repair protein MutL